MSRRNLFITALLAAAIAGCTPSPRDACIDHMLTAHYTDGSLIHHYTESELGRMYDVSPEFRKACDEAVRLNP